MSKKKITELPVTDMVQDNDKFVLNQGNIAKQVSTSVLMDKIGVQYEDLSTYGIVRDRTSSNPDCTRIGNRSFHATLPVQSLMRSCVIDDNGKVVYYLDPNNSNLTESGEDAILDGRDGMQMVEVPEHYIRYTGNGTDMEVRISLLPFKGAYKVKRFYISSNEASIERSTGKLCSVVNNSDGYRGGNNTASWDGTYRSLLGRPVTSMSRTQFRAAARLRNGSRTSEWNCQTYVQYKAVFWLFVIEYATLNSQKAVNATKDSNGFAQGGLGNGVSNMISWDAYNSYNPFVPCGYTNTLGNGSGEKAYNVIGSDGNVLFTVYVNRYRGIENIFGHIYKNTDGINIRVSAEVVNGGDGLSKVYITEEPSRFNDSNYTGYRYVGNAGRNEGYIKDIIFGKEGDIIASVTQGSSSTFYCDSFYTSIPSSSVDMRTVLFGGTAVGGSNGGLAYVHSGSTPSYSAASIGSRLCFIPE